jgi:hypothetical protein
MKGRLPTHSKCLACGHETRLALWVYAHWDAELIATCEKCGYEQLIRRGITYALPGKRKKPVSR